MLYTSSKDENINRNSNNSQPINQKLLDEIQAAGVARNFNLNVKNAIKSETTDYIIGLIKTPKSKTPSR
jgi:hypothetical protein